MSARADPDLALLARSQARMRVISLRTQSSLVVSKCGQVLGHVAEFLDQLLGITEFAGRRFG
jgi:hypothetical protein